MFGQVLGLGLFAGKFAPVCVKTVSNICIASSGCWRCISVLIHVSERVIVVQASLHLSEGLVM